MENVITIRMIRPCVSAIFTLQALFAGAQLTVDNTTTPQELVENILVGQGVVVNNVIFNKLPGNTINDQIASFNGSTSNLGLNTGIVLATGRVAVVTGPNLDLSAALSPAMPYNTADPDLLLLGSSITLRDQAILEFDFIPTGDSVSFRFVFGSEEYPEFVCSQWNDVFGFFLSGPGIEGPFSNNGINLALIPGTNVPIAINTLNGGVPGVLGGGAHICAASDPNWQANSVYYVDNTGGLTHQLDGTTIPLVAGARVRCGEVYHIKIAITDVDDGNVDSAVFLEGGSFTSPGNINTSIILPGPGERLVEGCGTATLLIERPENEGDLVVDIELAGEGITSGDVSGIPSQVTIPDGTSSVSIGFVAVSDGITEGQETLVITCTTFNDCGNPAPTSISVIIMDYDPVSIAVEDVSLRCDQDEVHLEAIVEGGLGELTLSWSTGDTGPTTHVPGLINGNYLLSVTDECPRTVTANVSVLSGCELTIPNVISPNGDGMNDLWVIEGIEGTEHTVRVFNRWGQVVLETNGYRNTWDGGDTPDGTYFYEVQAIAPEQRTYTGTLTILGKRR